LSEAYILHMKFLILNFVTLPPTPTLKIQNFQFKTIVFFRGRFLYYAR
jgi:hypothetical protein